MTEHRKLKGGEIRVLGQARAKHTFHNPKTLVRPIQWQPETGVTRYEWARSRTPKNQLPYFQHLQRIYRLKTPTPLPPDIAAQLNELDGDLSEAEVEGFRETIAEHEIYSRDPDGEWLFMISAETWRGMLCDRLVVLCLDRWTMPDFELLLRFRSWVLEDSREAFMWLPGQDGGDPPSLGLYENTLWNSLHLISPRLTQQGEELPKPTQG